ncbi:hypothetical protein PSHT_01354 [Puccinia striiformis]|uniref:Uncharacterized protein n=2 Tax=Puccinia striiformis TaxID=27350 RepID=A0A2S4UXI8_9BASI|nr:hypothetical protein PSTT_12124 [Puccinia striiformis]POW22393.1 hypothetical protein PSHT_01354 [Puccinia striiformis]
MSGVNNPIPQTGIHDCQQLASMGPGHSEFSHAGSDMGCQHGQLAGHILSNCFHGVSYVQPAPWDLTGWKLGVSNPGRSMQSSNSRGMGHL